jgi:uncharacterized membrane protein
LLAPLMHPQARTAARVAVAAELVIDKLPTTPSRLGTRGLTARVTLAGAAAVFLARGNNRPVLPNVLASWTMALVAARVGHDLRVIAGTHVRSLAVASPRTQLPWARRRHARLIDHNFASPQGSRGVPRAVRSLSRDGMDGLRQFENLVRQVE